MKAIYSQVLQDVIGRVDAALKQALMSYDQKEFSLWQDDSRSQLSSNIS